MENFWLKIKILLLMKTGQTTIGSVKYKLFDCFDWH